METTTQELIYQVITLVITGVLTVLGAYLKKLIQTKIDVTKYGFENDRVERIIDNAVHYAESYTKEVAKKSAVTLSQSQKLDYARHYINQVDKSIVAKYGEQLDRMIERKSAQAFGVGNER